MSIRYLLVGLLLLSGMLGTEAWAAPSQAQVKAVYLNGYAKFIRWPTQSFAAADTPFRICVLGESPFGNALNLVVKDEKLEQRPLQAVYIHSQSEIGTCQILYICDSEALRLQAILTAAADLPVLTVSDLDDFVQQGGMIQFYLRQNRVRFFIDPATLRQAGLEPNANLLRVSDVVKR